MNEILNEQTLADRWLDRVRSRQLAHNRAARVFSKRHLYLGIPVIITSAIAGTGAFATWEEAAPEGKVFQLRLLTGLLSITAAILASMQTFLQLAEVAERHRVAGIRYGSLKHELELLLSSGKKIPGELLSTFEERWTKIAVEAPTIPEWILQKAEANRVVKLGRPQAA